MKKQKIKRALVISGGAAKGAWGGGFLQYLIEEKKYDWDMYFGTSTGSLLVMLTALHEMKRLKEGYTSVTNKSIFSVNPFNKKGKVRIGNAIWRTIRGKSSLGEGGGLYKLIREMFTIEDFGRLNKMKCPVYICATDFLSKEAVYTTNLDEVYDTFTKFIWASSSVPVAFDFVDVRNMKLLDGGVTHNVPIQKAIDEGADEVDVIVFRTKHEEYDHWKPTNWFNTLLRTLDIQLYQSAFRSIDIGLLKAKNKDVKIRIRYLPYKLTNNSLMFRKKEMTRWWNEGYEYAKQDNTSVKIYLEK